MNNHQEIIRAQYILLVRHGDREKPFDVTREDHHLENYRKSPLKRGKYKKVKRNVLGRPKSLSLAGWLAETMHIYQFKVSTWFTSPHKHSLETTKAYRDALMAQNLCDPPICSPEQIAELKPEKFWHNKKVHKKLIDRIEPANNGKAIVISGHQPQLTWIFRDFLKLGCILPPWQPNVLPLRQSEVACIQLFPRRQLLWAISDNHEKTTNELKDKISSKFNLAKIFTGFTTAFLGILFSRFGAPTDSYPGFFGLCFVLLSLGLGFAALFSYDRLLMPSVFWSGKPSNISEPPPRWTPRRPPTHQNWILYFNMVRIWNCLFIPAVIFLFLGLTTLFVVSMKLPFNIKIGSVSIIILLIILAMKRFSPELGFDD